MRPAPLLLWLCVAWAVLGLAVSIAMVPAAAWWVAGAVIAVLEAMKMEHELTAGTAGSVSEIRVSDGDQVEAGAVIAVIERNPGWLEALARQVGGAVTLRSDPALAISAGHAEPA